MSVTIEASFSTVQDTCTLQVTYVDGDGVTQEIAPAGTAMTSLGAGTYEYVFTEPDYDLKFDYTISATLALSTTTLISSILGPTRDVEGTAYLTLAEAQTYLNGRLNTTAWDYATSSDRGKALIQATRLIDKLNFVGEKNDEDQELQFPRYDDTEVPTPIKQACIEIALSLLDGIDPELESENLRLLRQSYGNTHSTYNGNYAPLHIINKIPSSIAWDLLVPYIRDVSSVTLYRIN